MAPALNEPLHADPTPLRKAPSLPPFRAEAHAAAKARWGVRRDAAGVEEMSSAVAPTDAGTPDAMRDEEMDGHRETTAARRHPSMQKQQQHGVQGPDSPGSPAGDSEEPLDAASKRETFSRLLTPVTDATAAAAAAAAPLAAKPTADDANADGVEGNKSPNKQLTPFFEEAVTQQQMADLHQQQQHQQKEISEGGQLPTSAESSEMGSSPVTPFAGPDPLSGDAPLSPRLTGSYGRGEVHGVPASAVSFLLSVRQQLEEQAARLQDEEQQGLPQQQDEEGEKTQELLQQKGASKGCDAKEEAMLEQRATEPDLQQNEQQKQNEQQQQHEHPRTPASSEVSRCLQQEEQQHEGTSPAAAISTEDADAGRSDAAPPIPRNSCSSNDGGGSPSSPAVAGAPIEGLLSKPVTDREDAGRCISGNSSLTCSSATSPEDEAAAANDAKGNSSSTSSSLPQHPQWRMQWRALDALTSKLLQGLPRALTAVADGDEIPIGAAATTAGEAATAETPTALESTQIIENREEVPKATPAAAETPPALPCVSWVEYREERLRGEHLLDTNKQKEGPTHDDQDVDAHINDAGGEEVEILQLLQQRLHQRALAHATAAAEQLLLHPAKSRNEWAETCAKTQQLLQGQLQQELEPLVSQTVRGLQQLEEALEGAASRIERAAEAKRRRLMEEPWERGFIALAEKRHVALQRAASEVDNGAVALGRFLEEETQLTEEIEAADAEIQRFADTSGDLLLLADIRHKESVVRAFERLSGMRVQRVSATGLVAELAWPRSFPAAAALRASAASPSPETDEGGGLLQRLSAAGDVPVPPTRITISWSTEKTQQLPQQHQPQGASLPEKQLRRLHAKPSAGPPPTAPTPPLAACTEAATPVRQRVTILRPFLPAGSGTCDSAVCTPLLARSRGGALAAAPSTTAGAPAVTSAPTGPALQQHQQQRVLEGATGHRFLPITSCKLQSRFPVLRAAADAATKSGRTQAEALPPHRRWLYSVEMLRYLLLGAVQRSLQQMLLRQGETQGTASSPPTVAADGPSCLRRAVAAASGTEGIRRSSESGSLSSGYSGSSNTPPAACEQRAVKAPPFPDLSTVRALLLHAHAAAGRVALLHDQLLLLLRSFRSITSVDFEEKADAASLPLLVFKTAMAPCNDELPVLQLRLDIDLNEALSEGSLLLAVAGLRVCCLSAADDSCSDGQAAYSALRRAIESRLEAMWDAEKQQLSSEKFSRIFSDEGLVECLYTACEECGYTRSIEDWRLRLHEETPAPEENASSPNVPWGAAEAAALDRWVTLVQETGFVPHFPQEAASTARNGL